MSEPTPAACVAGDGKQMILIPCGEFLSGEDRQPVNLPEFCIDKYPVTNAEYKRFMNATGYPRPQNWYTGTFAAGKENHPVTAVNWGDATAYAKWAGKRLPTEEEWEKAARGTDGRKYPWGNEWDAARANTCESRILDTTPVGRYSPQGDSPYGVSDMAGNVWEWVQGPLGKMLQPMRGGTWNATHDEATCYGRLRYTPGRRNDYVGFRCAMDVGPAGAGCGERPVVERS